ncbi:ROK family protein [Streptomyces sp. NPDC094472]|uniref:ROK family protein n=1 Tax=unclassified Streptomyces TaxID=2593676 RepID=UPI0033218B75
MRRDRVSGDGGLRRGRTGRLPDRGRYGGNSQVAELTAALAAGDRTAHAVLARAGAHIGKVLGDVCPSPGPDVIVVGGELVDAGPALLEPIERELNAKVMRGSWPPLRVRPARARPRGHRPRRHRPAPAAVAGAAPLLRQSGGDGRARVRARRGGRAGGCSAYAAPGGPLGVETRVMAMI